MNRVPTYHALMAIVENVETWPTRLEDAIEIQEHGVLIGNARQIESCLANAKLYQFQQVLANFFTLASRVPCSFMALVLSENTPANVLERDLRNRLSQWSGWPTRVYVALTHVLWAIRDIRSAGNNYGPRELDSLRGAVSILRRHVEFVPSERHFDILTTLKDGPQKLDDLNFSLDWGRATVVKYVGELIDIGLVKKTKAGYVRIDEPTDI